MKKTISVIICFLITLFIGVPVMNSASKYMRAAEVYEGEKVVDIEFPAVDSAYSEASAYRFYAVTENKNLFYRGATDGSYGSPQWSLARDVNGKVLENVKYVSSIQYSECSDEYMALREDDQFYIAGTSDGKFGDGDNSGIKYADAKLINPSIANIKAVELGYRVSFLLTNDGSLYASGDNEHGQFGNGTTTSSSTFIRLPIDNVKKIVFVYPNTVYALKNDGTVWGWGGYVYDGRTEMNEVTEPVQIYNSLSDINGFFENAVDIIGGISQNDIPILGITTIEEDNVILYAIGEKYRGGITVHYSGFKNGVNPNNVSSPTFFVSKSTKATLRTGILIDGLAYQGEISDIKSELKNVTFESYDGTDETKAVKMLYEGQISYILNHKGEIWNGRYKEDIKLPLVVTGFKQDSTQYKSSEKYNDSVTLNIISTSQSPATCEVENPLGSTATVCTDFKSNSIDIDVKENERVYRKYIIANEITNEEFIVDLYKAKPKLQKYSITSSNKIKSTDIIDLSVPTEQSNWNKYTATITDSFGNTKDYNGETLDVGRYTFLVKDSYGNTQDYQFEVTDNPEPTAVFTPSSIDLVYKDSYTKVNGIIGNFSLQYPVGEPTSTIASIQLGTSGDESHFSIDTTGTLKVKGSDLDAGTYNITVSGKDANQMDFTKTVQIVVGKANQDNYQITNNANYNFLSNQEIAITTSGNESGENETYSIINGHTVAQISNTNKFKMLSAGTFTLEATVAGNNNYNSKTVTKQITLSQLPTQTNPIKISSGDSMMYGNTYSPTSTGGTGSGNVTWTIENDSGTGASLNNGSIRVTGVGTFTLKVTKAGDTNYQSSSDSKVITVKQRKTVVKPKDVTRKVGEAFKDNGVTYNPQPIAGDHLGTPIITSKYPLTQQAGRYTDGIQVTGLTNPNYDFEYQEGTLIINDTTLPNNGSGYYKIEGTKGKNNWYVSDIKISTLNKDGYDLISSDGITFGTTPLIYQTDGDYQVTFYLKNSATGIIAKGINYQVKIDQTPPTVPTLTMNQLNTSRMARLINFLSFGNWMNTGAEVVMSSTDGTSGIDNYSYVETDTKGTSNTKTSTTGKVTYQDDVEIGITAKACDKAGNCSDLSASETLMIDRKGPDITGVKDQSVYKYYYLPRFVKVKDSGSGLSYAEYKKDGTQAGTIQEDVNERIDGVGKYEVNAIDNAGNESTLSFEIVPLPDIEDIDGSDESKDIIDQVKDEYEEVKDNLTDEERKEYEDWIKDAEDKWESERKEVIETDDKSSKVEGQNGTTFDPNLELIVNDISNQPIPPLPKNANVVYDVYLQKGNTKVEPDGSIKVYLPYTDNEDPIIYQIDENGKVTEIKAEKEGNYVTFITDELGKFAISNTAQPDNKDNMCVVGPDGKVESGDEVCGKPNDKGDQPTKKPDGSVEVPDGGKVEFPNGTEIETPDGAIINPDGSVTLPDGTEYDPDGNIKDDKKVCELDGKDINIDTDGDGLPDLNLDIDHDCIADLNIDTNFDNIPDINIDTKGDGKPDINVDTDGDGKANINIAVVKRWIPNKNCNYNGFAYDTGEGFTPILNIDDDGDGNPDRNIDDDGDGIPDRNIDPDWFDKYGNQTRDLNANIGGANTGDTNEWSIWWVLFIGTGCILLISRVMKRYDR